MTDSEAPERDIEARLIRAGMRESPPSGTLQRTLAGLGLGASAIATASVSSAGALGATKATAPITAIVLAKWASLGAAGGILLSSAAYGVHHATRPSPPRTPSAVVTPRAMVHAAPAASTIAREPRLVEEAPVLALPSDPSPPPVAAPANAVPDGPLAAELALVDRAREAFQNNDPKAALTLLEDYERAFPERRLMPEVLYLRMRAHAELGDAGRATKLAERLFRDFPRGPHASSARAILQGTPAP